MDPKPFRLMPVQQTFASELATGESDVPFRRWVHAAPFGTQVLADRDGTFEFGQVQAEKVVEVWRHYKDHDRRAIFDWGHGSLKDVAPEVGGKSGVVMAWEIRTDGLWALGEFTPRAEALIRSEDFDQVSPEIWGEFKNLDTDEWEDGPAIFAIALTARPALSGLNILAASERSEDRGAESDPATGAEPMSDKRTMTDEQAALIEALGDTTPEQLTLMLSIRAEVGDRDVQTLRSDLERAAKADEDAPDLSAAVTALQAEVGKRDERIDAMSTELDTMRDERKDRDAAAIVEAYEAKGVIVPASRAAYVAMAKADPESFKALAETLPRVVNLQAEGTGGGGGEAGNETESTVHTRIVALSVEIAEAAGKTKADAGEFYPEALTRFRTDNPDEYRAYMGEAPANVVTLAR